MPEPASAHSAQTAQFPPPIFIFECSLDFMRPFSLRWYLCECESWDISVAILKRKDSEYHKGTEEDQPTRSMRIDMEFASFTCVFVVDSTVDPKHHLTMERVAVAKGKAETSPATIFSITHFDTNLEATMLLSTSDTHV
jgi:hypothetical protein